MADGKHKAIVIDAIRVPNADGTGYTTVKPVYKSRNGKRVRVCPVVELSKHYFDAYKQVGHVVAATGNAKEVRYEFDGKVYTKSRGSGSGSDDD